MQRVLLYDEWGCPFDLRHDVPAREYQAFLAVLQGRNERRREDAEKAERESKRKGGRR